jgi:hypothetical protein
MTSYSMMKSFNLKNVQQDFNVSRMCDEEVLDLSFKNSRSWIIILDNMNKKNSRVSLLKNFCIRDQLKYVNNFFSNIRIIIHRFFLFNASINEFVRLWAFHMISIQFEDFEICHCCVEDWICNIILVSFSYVSLFLYSKNEIFAVFENEDVLKKMILVAF